MAKGQNPGKAFWGGKRGLGGKQQEAEGGMDGSNTGKSHAMQEVKKNERD